jgi:type II secretory pathway pseudopilin PulG
VKRSTDPGRRDGAFTLLEVLAAVAILGIWFSVLASVAIQGQRSEGETERKIRASLIADRALMDVELGFAQGEFPGDTMEEFEEDGFVVQVESLSLTDLVIEIEEGLIDLLETELTGIAPDLRGVQVTVRWTEGHAEKQVTRITYAYDPTRLNEALGAMENASAEADDASEGNPQ